MSRIYDWQEDWEWQVDDVVTQTPEVYIDECQAVVWQDAAAKDLETATWAMDDAKAAFDDTPCDANLMAYRDAVDDYEDSRAVFGEWFAKEAG